MDPDMFVKNDNVLLPYKLRPNYQGYCAGKEVRIDADGYRTVQPSYDELHVGKTTKPDRVVLLLGDSGIFGFGVSDRDTIASQLQEASFKKNLNYQIRNVGVNGYTSWNEYAAFSDYLTKHSATDVIVLYMPNDVTFDNDYFRIGQGDHASFSRNEDRLRRLNRFLYSHVYVSYLISDSLKKITTRIDNPAATVVFDENQRQREIDYSLEALKKLADLCKHRNINFSTAIYRDVAYEADPKGWLKYEESIERNLDRNGVKWFLAKSHMDNLTAREVRSSWNDPHPGSKAIGFIVKDLLNELR
ncbi:MAG TPA: hypothetical protein DC047_02235 [Blastocatellia bacterium]|nr:hypothetical protein [Blastocatellia bacterium]